MSYCISDYLNEKWINNKALKISNKDIIYAQIDSDNENWELILYLKFGNEERWVGNVLLPTNFDLNFKWYEIDEIKGLIDDYLEDEEADYEVINYE
ncbi:hypothetical protein D6D54_04415 [Spiroplasma poulsonii]|uniref:Uncharacterized protein n=1 Tax=Spiroplasma poulsonii TaxID=2138 RepID=A0A3S0TY83_9MOLU|nr:hypothetical protein [Spiroplasma poulsonii]RUP77179.1 hypothetical protein D6D54_04415 [Spiroplasma poulsonii]